MKPLDQKDRDWSKGNCFYVTLELMKDSEELRLAGVVSVDASVSLVHGLLDADGKRVKHAWIEIEDKAIDLSNNQEIKERAKDYYRNNDAQVARRFTRAEADALLEALPSGDGSLPIGYWGDLGDEQVAAAIDHYDEESGAFASGICFSDPTDPANADNLDPEGNAGSHERLKTEIRRLVENRLGSLLVKCHWFSLTWDGDVLELHLQEDKDSVSSQIALRLACFERTTQVQVPNIAFPKSWRGHRIGMHLIQEIFQVCDKYSYALFITDMVESFHRYMLSLGACRTDHDTVEITPTTRLG